MQERTCAGCGTDFVPTDKRQTYCTKRCQKRYERQRYRAKLVPMTCAHCEREFLGRRWDKVDADHQRRYCSLECDTAAKSKRFTTCTHGTTDTRNCPACTFTARTEGSVAWRDVLRADPCAYCGSKPPNGLDHIDSAARHPDRSDRTNWTGCCKRCNEIKNTLPLLLALPWIPVAQQYHAMRRELYAA